MRENQVFSTGMQIERLTQFFHGHHRALQVPTRPSWSDRSIPESLAWLGRFPDSKVARAVFFVFVHIDAGPVDHPAEIFLGKFAVLRKAGNSKVIGSIVGAVGVVFPDKL